MSGPEECPEWCDRLHDLADAVRDAVAVGGWRVRAVAVIVSPEDVRLPEVMLGSRIELPAADPVTSSPASEATG